jgi:hypothetical protein
MGKVSCGASSQYRTLHGIHARLENFLPSNLKRFMLGAKGAAVGCGLSYQDGRLWFA